MVSSPSARRVRPRPLAFACLFSLLCITPQVPANPHSRNSSPRAETTAPSTTSGDARESYGKLPLHFERNAGQTNSQVEFIARGKGHTIFLTATEAVLTLRREQAAGARGVESGNAPERVVRIKLIGSNSAPRISGEGALAGVTNYLDAETRVTGAPTYESVRYAGVYKGVDVLYYGAGTELEYDFQIAPGADARQIQMRFTGADRIHVNEGGDLVLRVGAGELRQSKPFAYQVVGGARREVASRYMLQKGGRVGFALGRYDRRLPLVIDPVLSYSTYFGSDASPTNSYDAVTGIAVDAEGNAYVTGYTQAPNFPVTPNAFTTTVEGGIVAFVAKLDSTGTRLIYSTYLGRRGLVNGTYGTDISVDKAGNAYVAGLTDSNCFPTTPGAFLPTSQRVGGGGCGYLGRGFEAFVFVSKLNPSGTNLVYSTLLGKAYTYATVSLAVDDAGHAYLTGGTVSPEFPTTPGAYSRLFNPNINILRDTSGNPTGSASDSVQEYVTKLNPSGTALVYSTFLGVGGPDFTLAKNEGGNLAVDAQGNAYVTGWTNRGGQFPTTPGAFDETFNGVEDWWVTKLNADGSRLLFSTFLGGAKRERSSALALDAAGNAYVTGWTSGDDFPITADAYDTSYNGGLSDTVVAKLAADGKQLFYSTLIGAERAEQGNDIAVDAAGNAYVAGVTSSSRFPTSADALRRTFNQPACCEDVYTDAFALRLNATGSLLDYSTYYGGGAGANGTDNAFAIALDAADNFLIAGVTSSLDLPTTAGALKQTFAKYTESNGFIAKFDQRATATTGGTLNKAVQFTSRSYVTQFYAGTSVPLSVVRLGDASTILTVDYATAGGTAIAGRDYLPTSGSLRFDAGETLKTFFVNTKANPDFAERATKLDITLTNPSVGTPLGTPAIATLTILNKDREKINPIDDARLFVRQQYVDFLNREPDAPGLNFWTREITECTDAARRRAGETEERCVDRKRVNTSGAFFLSAEFQHTGGFVARLYRGALERTPRYAEWRTDAAQVAQGIVRDNRLAADVINSNKREFVRAFVARDEFRRRYDNLDDAAFVDALLRATGATTQSASKSGDLVSALRSGATTRADVVLQIVDGTKTTADGGLTFTSDIGRGFYERDFNSTFVLTQYFGYLQRDPDQRGYDFWLAKLNRFGNFIDAEMVRSFIVAREYRQRFGVD